MNSEARRAFDAWFAEEYLNLVESARGMHRDPFDLVHHTYAASVKAAPVRIMDNPAGYFHTAMWMQATRGSFKDLYVLRDAPRKEIVAESNIGWQIAREEAMLLTHHLRWFDRQVLKLYLEGYNLRSVSRESGIPHTTLYQSLHRTRKKLRNALSI